MQNFGVSDFLGVTHAHRHFAVGGGVGETQSNSSWSRFIFCRATRRLGRPSSVFSSPLGFVHQGLEMPRTSAWSTSFFNLSAFASASGVGLVTVPSAISN